MNRIIKSMEDKYRDSFQDFVVAKKLGYKVVIVEALEHISGLLDYSFYECLKQALQKCKKVLKYLSK